MRPGQCAAGVTGCSHRVHKFCTLGFTPFCFKVINACRHWRHKEVARQGSTQHREVVVMKGNNSILPPGANFEGARRGRSNMRMAVVVVVMLHVVLFTGILFQAC